MKRVGIASSILLVIGFAALAGNPTPSPPADASATRRGLVNTGSQTLGGLKTFVDGGIIATLRTGSTFEGTVILTGLSDGGVPFVVPTPSNSETTQPLTLYLSPDGGDLGPCSITAPCRTPPGAWSKIPARVLHNVTIQVANGVYDLSILQDGGNTSPDGGPQASSLMEGLSMSGNTSVRFSGDEIVLDTGTMAYDAGGTFPGFPVIVDSSKNWTVNQWRFAFVRNLLSDGGVLSTQPIVSNTSTQLTLAATLTSATQGGAFEIVTPGATFVRTDLVGPVLAFGNNNGTVLVDNLDFRNTNTTATSCGTYSCAAIYMGGLSQTTTLLTGTGANLTSPSLSLFIRRSRVQVWNLLSQEAIRANGGSQVSVSNSSLIATPASIGGNASTCFGTSNVQVTSTNNYCSAMRAGVSGSSSTIGVTGGITEVENINPSGNHVGAVSSRVSISSHRMTCTTLTNQVIAVSLVQNTFSNINSVSVTGCKTGLSVRSGSLVSNASGAVVHSFVNTETAYLVDSISSLALANGILPTFSGVTNEFLVDGVSSTFAALNSASPKFINGLLGSRVSIYVP